MRLRGGAMSATAMNGDWCSPEDYLRDEDILCHKYHMW